jgi:hypothetical protein
MREVERLKVKKIKLRSSITEYFESTYGCSSSNETKRKPNIFICNIVSKISHVYFALSKVIRSKKVCHRSRDPFCEIKAHVKYGGARIQGKASSGKNGAPFDVAECSE